MCCGHLFLSLLVHDTGMTTVLSWLELNEVDNTEHSDRTRQSDYSTISSYRTSPVVQWLRLHASTAGAMSSIPRWRTKIPHAMWCGQEILKKRESSYYYYERDLGTLGPSLLPLSNPGNTTHCSCHCVMLLVFLLEKCHLPVTLSMIITSSPGKQSE